MALLKSRSTPPGGWTYLQAETQAIITDENKDALVDRVVEHRKYKGLTPTDREEVRKEIERQICSKLGHNECRKEGPEDKWTPRDGSKPKVGMTQVLAFSKAAIAFITSGGELVPIEEAQRRAEICRACHFNQEMTGCSCDIFYKILDAAIPKARKLPGLHVCGVCNCTNSVKVNLTKEQVLASNKGRDLQWPIETACWQRDLYEQPDV